MKLADYIIQRTDAHNIFKLTPLKNIDSTLDTVDECTDLHPCLYFFLDVSGDMLLAIHMGNEFVPCNAF